MADEVNIGDQYFTQEDKDLSFTIYQDKPDYYDPEGLPIHTGPVQDITGWDLSFMVKKKKTYADSSALITKTTGGGGIAITDGVNGRCQIALDDADIVDIVGGNLHYYELKRVTPVKTVLAQGEFKLKQAVHE